MSIERQGRFEETHRHHNEKEKYCHTCGFRTTHLYDHGTGMYECGDCMMKEDR